MNKENSNNYLFRIIINVNFVENVFFLFYNLVACCKTSRPRGNTVSCMSPPPPLIPQKLMTGRQESMKQRTLPHCSGFICLDLPEASSIPYTHKRDTSLGHNSEFYGHAVALSDMKNLGRLSLAYQLWTETQVSLPGPGECFNFLPGHIHLSLRLWSPGSDYSGPSAFPLPKQYQKPQCTYGGFYIHDLTSRRLGHLSPLLQPNFKGGTQLLKCSMTTRDEKANLMDTPPPTLTSLSMNHSLSVQRVTSHRLRN